MVGFAVDAPVLESNARHYFGVPQEELDSIRPPAVSSSEAAFLVNGAASTGAVDPNRSSCAADKAYRGLGPSACAGHA